MYLRPTGGFIGFGVFFVTNVCSNIWFSFKHFLPSPVVSKATLLSSIAVPEGTSNMTIWGIDLNTLPIMSSVWQQCK